MKYSGITVQRPPRTARTGPPRREMWPEMALLYMQGYSYSAIGRMVGRDHATVMNAIRKIQRHIDITPEKRILHPRAMKAPAAPKAVRPKKRRVDTPEPARKVERLMDLAALIAKREWKKRSIAA